MAKDIYNLNKRKEYTEKSLSLLDKSDRKLIERYVDEKEANGISPLWAEYLKCTLAKWRGWLPVPFDQLTKQDVIAGMKAMKGAEITKHDGRVQKYSQNHQHNLVKDLKAFLNWLIRNKIIDGMTLDEVKIDIKKPKQNFDIEDAKDLIKPDELILLIQYAKGARNKALIATVYETNGRIDEVRRLQWKDITFDQHGAEVLIDDQKENKKKALYLHEAVPYLATWRNEYKGEPTGKAIVFPSGKDGQGLHYGTLWKILDEAAKDSGIAAAREKDGRHKVHWHLLRKSRITNMIKEGYKPSTVSMAAWGTTDSRTLRVYLKLADTDVIDDMKRMAGVNTNGGQQQPPKAKIAERCIKCTTENPIGADYCIKCGEPMTEAALAKQKSLEDQIMDRIMKKLAESGALKQ